MVGGFPIIVAFQPGSLQRRDRACFSAPALIVTLILMHSALVDQGACVTASAAHVSRAMLRMGTNNIKDVNNLSHREPNVLSHKLQNLSPLANTQSQNQKHRHLLVIGMYAVASTAGGADHAGRALVGSSPPTCIKKCGKCTPCKSVLVPIHTTNLPATPAEYYPEAWRCQCKGKIYNP